MPGKEKQAKAKDFLVQYAWWQIRAGNASRYEIVENFQSVEGERGSHAVVLGLYLVVFVRFGHGGESELWSWENDTSSSIKSIELETKRSV